MEPPKSRHTPDFPPDADANSQYKFIDFLHFNDVYNVEERENHNNPNGPKYGAARFISHFTEYGSKEKLTLFSGDLISPSILSNVNRGG